MTNACGTEWPAGCGSGPGRFEKGELITTLDQIPPGALIFCESPAEPVPTTNIARVVRHAGPESAWDGDAALCVFVHPDDPSRPRMASDSEWMLILPSGGSYFEARQP